MEQVKFVLRWLIYCIYWPNPVRLALVVGARHEATKLKAIFSGWGTRQWIIFNDLASKEIGYQIGRFEDFVGRIPLTAEYCDMTFEVFFNSKKQTVQRAPTQKPMLDESILRRIVTDANRQYLSEQRELEGIAEKRRKKNELVSATKKQSEAHFQNCRQLYNKLAHQADSLERFFAKESKRVSNLPLQIKRKLNRINELTRRQQVLSSAIIANQRKLLDLQSVQMALVVEIAKCKHGETEETFAKAKFRETNAEVVKQKEKLRVNKAQKKEIDLKFEEESDQIQSSNQLLSTSLNNSKTKVDSIKQLSKECRAFVATHKDLKYVLDCRKILQQQAAANELDYQAILRDLQSQPIWQLNEFIESPEKKSDLDKLELLIHSSRVKRIVKKVETWIRQKQSEKPIGF